MRITTAEPAHWPLIWPFWRDIVRAGDTYTYWPDTDEATARDMWMLAPPSRTVVALDDDGRVLGTAKMNRNHMGGGAHVAGASFMVDPAAQGRGVGRALCEYVLDWARAEGYRAIQFNAVVETNTRAVKLYGSLGFAIAANLREGFRHPELGYVGLLVMYRML
ncbi:GNAT family N-acetyltransferase [Yinghuangia aomiensis]|uniref:GNAT family N-acetyltransferase n=1 Tax=Yinghuangia aomiensis TaxID=676205 RepID=A0ABP9HEE9_9ACTN